MRKKYDFSNFFVGTAANWTLCEIPDRDPDFYSFSGSTYWDLGDRVRRWSNHWGPDIASCRWFLEFKTLKLEEGICGECLYDEFRPNPNFVFVIGESSRLATAPRLNRDEDKTLGDSTSPLSAKER